VQTELTAAAGAQPGALINGRWRLERLLGAGADCDAWAARDERTGRAVALKALRGERDEEGGRARLRAEFAALAALDHPHLVAVYDLDASDGTGGLARGRAFFTAELCRGAPPSQRLAALSPDERARSLVQLAAEVASALAYLHGRGLVHHDVKPENLLADERGRTRLGDLGLSTVRGVRGGLRGTPAYLPPEALGLAAALHTDADDVRGDLYALGATLWALWRGRPPRAGSTVAELVAEAARPLPALDDAPPRLAALVAHLAAIDPRARPSSAAAVVDEATVLGARLAGDVLAPQRPRVLHRPPFVGRAAELAAAVRHLDGGGRLLLVAGAPGSGRSRFVDELRRALQLADASRARPARSFRSLDRLAVEGSAPAALLAGGDALLHLDLTGATPSARARELLALAARASDGEGAAVIAEVPTELALPEDVAGVALRLALPPLTTADTLALADGMLADGARDGLTALADAVQRASGGEPARAVELIRGAAAHAPAGQTPGPGDVAALGGAALTALVAARLAKAAPDVRAVVEALAVLGRPARPDEVAALTALPLPVVAAAARAAAAEGLVSLGTRWSLPSRAHAGAVDDAALQALHARALQAIPDDGDGDDGFTSLFDRARHLRRLGPRADANAAALAFARAAASRGALPLAREAYAEVVAHAGDDDEGARARLGLADALLSSGDYAAARTTLAPLLDDARPAGAHTDEARLLLARIAQRAGDAALAEQTARALLDARPPVERPSRRARRARPDDDHRRAIATPSADLRAEAIGLYGRLLLQRGAYDDALAACAPAALDGAAPRACRAALEVRGLAALYLGRLDDADAAFAILESSTSDERLAWARARSLRGMVAQARDRLDDAARAYADALEAARAGHDLHGAAIYAANLGAVERERGELAAALPPSEAAARDLGRIGKRVERAGALFNLGNLLLSLGDLDGAAAAATEAATLGEAAPRETAFALLLAGDVARRRGALDDARDAYRRARALFPSDRDRVLALRSLAESEALAGAAAEAQALVDEAERLAASVGAAELVPLSAARVALTLDAPLTPARRAALVRVADDAVRTGRRELAFRASVTLARVAVREGALGPASAFVTRARAMWEEIEMRTPELRRPDAADDPDATKLRALVIALGPAAALPAATVAPPPSANQVDIRPRGDRDNPWRRLAAINKRLNSELRLDRLLELILDTVIDLTRAERGFILLAPPGSDGAFHVAAARNIDRDTPEVRDSFSRSIAERAAKEGAPIVTFDAAGDSRFEAALSVSDLKLRSVLAVPLVLKGRPIGCVYADNRLRAGAFGDDEVAVVCDLAEQAAIAIENARLLEENAARQREIAALATELERKVAEQAVELGELHKEVRSSRKALSIRYDYENLVGRTPRMIELFRLLDRITDTPLPVVIYGESGTGKELVARALHHNSPRRDRPFVSESCGAIPETLLEATLFGHVRGAFTSADADRRGLFEIAHGSTLFLDEVGEMTPAMQVKLLRVLQTGEFRRVGGERTVKVDVRVVVASNRDLGKLVEEGKFREDLFYRLNVVRVVLPPLRERREDIPLLVDHFLRKHAAELGRQPPRIARATLQRLTSYRWPGNVRELENEILRAATLGGELLTVDDLSPHIAAGEPDGASEGDDDLGLRRRVERLERTLVSEALQRTGGNQSHAARLLGLSRFGLQKKMQRYKLASDG